MSHAFSRVRCPLSAALLLRYEGRRRRSTSSRNFGGVPPCKLLPGPLRSLRAVSKAQVSEEEIKEALRTMRETKSDLEVQCLAHANRVTSDAHTVVMVSAPQDAPVSSGSQSAMPLSPQHKRAVDSRTPDTKSEPSADPNAGPLFFSAFTPATHLVLLSLFCCPSS